MKSVEGECWKEELNMIASKGEVRMEDMQGVERKEWMEMLLVTPFWLQGIAHMWCLWVFGDDGEGCFPLVLVLLLR